MTAPKWESGKLYLPGDIVQPITAPAPTAAQVVNGSFQSGGTGWDFTGLATYSSTQGYVGPGTVRIPGGGPGGSDDGGGLALNHTHLSVDPGGTLTARCMIRQGASDVDHTRGWVEIHWFNSADALVLSEAGNIVNDGRNGAWLPSSVSSTRPAGAAYARAGIYLWQGSGDAVDGDYLTVSGAQSGLPEGLVYKAVQPAAGMSGASEPAWPAVLGVQVVDNEVTWEAVATNRVTWTASPLYVSGATEPDWPTQPGGFVVDGTVQWEAVSRRVEDENCPNSKVVAIVASKVFAADRDIVRFSATANPLDWTSEQDAGYLPTGLQQANANDMAVLNQYRGNLVSFNASSFQNWQADPDPAAMAILDQMDGIGSTWQGAAQPVGNELFYLSQLGVRTIGIANAAENLAAGDVGMPIDPLVREAIKQSIIDGTEPVATYYPSAGQYWLAFPPPFEPTGDIAITGEFDEGTLGLDYSSGPLVATNAFAPLRWSITALPAGLTMGPSGAITGTPEATGTIACTVTVTDRYGRTASVERSIKVVFTSGLFVNDTTTVYAHSGDTAMFPLLQTFTAAGTGSDIACDDGANIVGWTRTSAPFFQMFKRISEVGFAEVAPPLDVMPTVVGQAAITADGQYLAVSQSTAVWLYKRTGDTFERVQTVALAGSAYNMKWSPSGEYLAVCHDSGAPYLVILRRAGDVLTALTWTDTWDGKGLAWTADSTKLAYARRTQGIRVLSVVGDTVTSLNTSYASTPGVSYVCWSGDEQYLYVGGNTDSPAGVHLWVYQWSGVSLTRVADPVDQPGADVVEMSRSKDGRVLALATNGGGYAMYSASGPDLSRISPTDIVAASGPNARVQFFESGDAA